MHFWQRGSNVISFRGRGQDRPSVREFVSDDVVRAVFRQWLDGVDAARLRDDDDAKKALKRFVIHALLEVEKGNDLKTKFQSLNRYTVDAKIPFSAGAIGGINVKSLL